MVNANRNTKAVRMSLRNKDPRKKAGSNRLCLTVQSDDWRIANQTVSMTIREAQALRNFLNENLD